MAANTLGPSSSVERRVMPSANLNPLHHKGRMGGTMCGEVDEVDDEVEGIDKVWGRDS